MGYQPQKSKKHIFGQFISCFCPTFFKFFPTFFQVFPTFSSFCSTFFKSFQLFSSLFIFTHPSTQILDLSLLHLLSIWRLGNMEQKGSLCDGFRASVGWQECEYLLIILNVLSYLLIVFVLLCEDHGEVLTFRVRTRLCFKREFLTPSVSMFST